MSGQFYAPADLPPGKQHPGTHWIWYMIYIYIYISQTKFIDTLQQHKYKNMNTVCIMSHLNGKYLLRSPPGDFRTAAPEIKKKSFYCKRRREIQVFLTALTASTHFSKPRNITETRLLPSGIRCPIHREERFQGTHCLLRQYRTLEMIYETIWHHTTEKRDLHKHGRENLKILFRWRKLGNLPCDNTQKPAMLLSDIWNCKVDSRN
jgi:hypothetical protein